MEKIEELNSNISVLMGMFGTIIPFSYMLTEVENYLGRQVYSDTVESVKRCNTFDMDYAPGFGLILAEAKTHWNRTFILYYDAKMNMFHLRNMTTNEKCLVYSWDIFLEEAKNVDIN